MLGEATIDRRATTGATCDSRHSTVGRRSSSVVGRRAVVALSAAGRRMSSLLVVGRRLSNVVPSIIAALILAFVTLAAHAEALASVASAEGAYTNHAGNVVSGVVVALDARTVTISNATETAKLPLSIFPESEQRRIAADYVLGQGGGQVELLRIPVAVKRAVAGAEKAMARSRKRAEKGLCTKDESEAFCSKSAAALRSYLDKQVKEGVITPAERKVIGH